MTFMKFCFQRLCTYILLSERKVNSLKIWDNICYLCLFVQSGQHSTLYLETFQQIFANKVKTKQNKQTKKKNPKNLIFSRG